MTPEEVPAELVEEASSALSMLRHGVPNASGVHTRREVRVALAAVLPEIQAQALEDLEVPLEEDYETRRRGLDKRHPAYREGFLDGHEYASNVVAQAAARLSDTTGETRPEAVLYRRPVTEWTRVDEEAPDA